MSIRRIATGLSLLVGMAACGGEAPEPGVEGTAGATSGAAADADSIERDAAVTADTQALPGDTAARGP